MPRYLDRARAVELEIQAMGTVPPGPPRRAQGYSQPKEPANPTPPSQREPKRMTWRCDHCGASNPDERFQCRNCGAPR